MSRIVNIFLLVCIIVLVLSVNVEGKLRGRFIHLTDTHILREYKIGSDPEKMCADGKGTAGEFGDYKCDPPQTVQEFAKETLKHREKPDFILYGGDHVSVWSPHQSIDHAVDCIKNISQDLREIRAAYGSDVRVFPMIGNHDSYPTFQFPKEGPFYIYEGAAEAWSDFLHPESIKTIRKGGYYTELIEPGLRLVVVNTALYFIGNVVFPETAVDPGGQLAWMRDVLQNAKNNKEYVFVAAHVPPGLGLDVECDMWNSLNDQYIRAFQGFNGNPVVASFYGHNHWATFRIISDENISVVSNSNSHVAFVSSSLTPSFNINPVFTEYTFLPEAPYTIIDRSYEYINLTKVNSAGTLEWNKAKSYREIFNLKTVDAESMNKAVIQMRNNDELFRDFYRDLRAYSPSGDTGCTSKDCKIYTLCGLNNTIYQSIHDCMNRYN